jgi:hypothetical protein
MIDFPKKLRGYAGLSDRPLHHIYRDPPSSKYTRKKERVEWGDVKMFVESDTSRYDEALVKFNKGINPSVAVEYQNNSAGSRTTTMSNREAKNPYKVVRDGAIRMPMYRQEDLRPLSRMIRPYTNRPGVPGIRSNFVDCGLAESIDKQPVQSATSVIVAGSPQYLPPTKSYIISIPTPIKCDQNIITDKKYESIQNPKSSSVKAEYFEDEFSKDLKTQQLANNKLPSEANKSNLVKATNSMPGTPLKDLEEMNNRETLNGIKEYTLLDQLYTNPSLNIYNSENNNNFNVNGIIEDNVNIPLSSNPSDANRLQQIHDELELQRKQTLMSVYAPVHDKDKLITTQDPMYQFEKNNTLNNMGTQIGFNYHVPGEQRLDREYKKQIREVNGSTTPGYFITRNNDELLLQRRENTKLNKKTNYSNFEVKPNIFTMDRQGLVDKLKRK